MPDCSLPAPTDQGLPLRVLIISSDPGSLHALWKALIAPGFDVARMTRQFGMSAAKRYPWAEVVLITATGEEDPEAMALIKLFASRQGLGIVALCESRAAGIAALESGADDFVIAGAEAWLPDRIMAAYRRSVLATVPVPESTPHA